MKREKKKISGTTVLLILIGFIGLSLLLYPPFSNYLNSMNQTQAINSYVEAVDNIPAEEYARYLNEAKKYNKRLGAGQISVHLSDSEKREYESLLNITGDGNMGYIEIPSIEVSLPIYHGVSDVVLRSSVGHLEWTSLPTGGKDTHCVLSGHRGLPSARLFTNLDKMELGDVFMLHILNETLTYEVDQILIVEPKDTKDLQIVKGKDYCTLMTCTPYGINTHRLLVRGHRIANIEEGNNHITEDAIQIEPLIVAPILAIPMLILLFILLVLLDNSQKYFSKEEADDDEM